MRLRSHGLATYWGNLLLTLSTALLLNADAAWAKKDTPGVVVKKLDNLPFNLQYFEDSNVVLFEDDRAQKVYRSEDAGETWDVLDQAAGTLLELNMHPFDPKRAYIISSDTTHWATDDRGKTWTEFKSTLQASIFRDALNFHAGDPDRIIFNGMDCSEIFCEEVVSLLREARWKGKAGLTCIDILYYEWLFGRYQIPEIRHCGVPLGEIFTTLYNWPERFG